MKKLHARWGDQVHFVDVLVRQAHPGPQEPHYSSFGQKLEDAQRYQQTENIPWAVLVDDLEGTVHQAYGGLADPTYLIDRDGRVAYYNMWNHAPTLWEAVEALMKQDGRGVVNGGLKRWLHMGAAMTAGWRGLRRGLPQSFWDMMLAAPGSPILPWLGYQFRPLLAPLALRAKPLPTAAKVGLALGVGTLAAFGLGWAMARSRRGTADGASIGSSLGSN